MIPDTYRKSIINRLQSYLHRFPNNYDGARKDAYNWAIGYPQGYGDVLSVEDKSEINSIINEELSHI